MHIANERHQEYIENFEKLWDLHKTDFDNTLTLLKIYCGHGKLLSRSHWNQYAKEVERVVSKYDGEEGYLNKYRDKALCTKEYLILDLGNQLYKEYTKCDDEFLALAQVLKNHLGIDLKRCIELIQEEGQEALYWSLDSQLDAYQRNNTLLSMYARCLPFDCYSKAWNFVLASGLIKGKDLIRYLLEKNEMRYCAQYLSSYTLPLGSKEEIRNLFVLALSKSRFNSQAYYNSNDDNAVYYLFCQYYGLEILDKGSDYVGHVHAIAAIKYLMVDLTTGINKPIENDLLLEVLEHIHKFGKEDYHEAYVILCNKSEWILNFSKVEEKFIEYFTPDYNHALFDACSTLSINTVNHLLKTKELTLSKKNWCRDSDFYRPFPYTSDCSYEIGLYRIKTTPLLGMVMNALYAYGKGMAINHLSSLQDFDYSYQDKVNVHMEIIKILIKHNPENIKISDESGKNIFDYLNVFKERVLCNEKRFPLNNIWQHIQEITDLVYNLGYGYNKFRMFSQGTSDENSILKFLPKDLQTEINRIHMNMYP